jgi:hypothetical protein
MASGPPSQRLGSSVAGKAKRLDDVRLLVRGTNEWLARVAVFVADYALPLANSQGYHVPSHEVATGRLEQHILIAGPRGKPDVVAGGWVLSHFNLLSQAA